MKKYEILRRSNVSNTRNCRGGGPATEEEEEEEVYKDFSY